MEIASETALADQLTEAAVSGGDNPGPCRLSVAVTLPAAAFQKGEELALGGGREVLETVEKEGSPGGKTGKALPAVALPAEDLLFMKRFGEERQVLEDERLPGSRPETVEQGGNEVAAVAGFGLDEDRLRAVGKGGEGFPDPRNLW